MQTKYSTDVNPIAAAFAAIGIRTAEDAETILTKKAEAEAKAEQLHELAEAKAARHARRTSREAAREEERKALKIAKQLTKDRQRQRLATYYKTVEMTVKMVETEVGDFAEIGEAKRGTLLASMRGNARLISRHWNSRKQCLAEHVPGLAEATTIVAIPVVDEDGERLDMEVVQQMMWEAMDKYGVPHWTQSSIKGSTHVVLYFVREELFDRLAAVYDLDIDGKRYANYLSLVFSEMDGDTIEVHVDEVEQANDGQDGNCAVPLDMVPMAQQFRVMKLHPRKKVPCAVGKGIVVPMKEARLAHINDSQVKMGKGEHGDFVMMTSNSVTTTPIKMLVSPEPLMLLNDCAEVRKFLGDRVREEVDAIMAEFGDQNRPALLKRLGGLSIDLAGHLMPALRAAIEALRSNVPWCREIEDKVGRFLVKMIAEKLIPSGAIQGYASLMVISDEHGVKECAREDAKYIMVRVPTTQIVFLDKDPYVKGKGYVVHSSVAKKMSGDADGDRVILIKELDVVEKFKQHLNTKIVSGLKPEKRQDDRPLNKFVLADLAMDIIRNSWLVGHLTISAWKFIQAGMFAEAGLAVELANDEPMTYKHDIRLGGKKFHDVAYQFIREHKSTLDGISLQWRDAQALARAWKSIRQMKDTHIARPASLFDVMWNAGVASVKAWDKKNPLHDLSLTRVARLVFAENKTKISGAAWREAREIIAEWGAYWGENRNEDGTLNDADHSMIYKRAEQWAQTASTEACAAILLWTPKAGGTGFSLKWHSVVSAGRLCEVIGYHPDVLAAIEEQRGSMYIAPEVDALVDALLDSIEM